MADQKPCRRGDIAPRDAQGKCRGPACRAHKNATKRKWNQRKVADPAYKRTIATEARKAAARRMADPAYRAAKNAKILEKHRADPRVAMVKAAKARARDRGVPFNITLDDINTHGRCPRCGVELKPNAGKAESCSPSLDRIVPALGYVKGNVTVICYRCNRLKGDSTPAERLMSVIHDAGGVEALQAILGGRLTWT